jgi:hypothetical protein
VIGSERISMMMSKLRSPDVSVIERTDVWDRFKMLWHAIHYAPAKHIFGMF